MSGIAKDGRAPEGSSAPPPVSRASAASSAPPPVSRASAASSVPPPESRASVGTRARNPNHRAPEGIAFDVSDAWPRPGTTRILDTPFTRVALFGGVYSNHRALEAAIADARARGADAMMCLGDLGGFGPHPNRTCELLQREGVIVQRGNYDHALALGLTDCGCGYTDPRDNHFAAVSYAYTRRMTSIAHSQWMATLPWKLVRDGSRIRFTTSMFGSARLPPML